MRSRVAIDLDGVVFNFSIPFVQFLKEEGVPVTLGMLNPKDWTYEMGDSVVPHLKKFFSTDRLDNFPLMDKYWSRMLGSVPFEYDFVTEFPEHCVHQRIENLKRCGLEEHNLIVVKDKYEFMRLNPKRYSLVIDDKPSFIEKMREGLPEIQMVCPVWNYNKYLMGKDKGILWYETLTQLKSIIWDKA